MGWLDDYQENQCPGVEGEEPQCRVWEATWGLGEQILLASTSHLVRAPQILGVCVCVSEKHDDLNGGKKKAGSFLRTTKSLKMFEGKTESRAGV